VPRFTPASTKLFWYLLIAFSGTLSARGPADADDARLSQTRGLLTTLSELVSVYPAESRDRARFLTEHLDAETVRRVPWEPGHLMTHGAITEVPYCLPTLEDCGPAVLTHPVTESERPFPLVLLAHGNGFRYNHYEHLADHLAHNGFAVASMDFGDDAEIEERIATILAHTDYLTETVPHLVGRTIALVGHSRGGEAAIHAVAPLTLRGYQVTAVVALAPSVLVETPPPSIDNLLILYGDNDEDVFGGTGPGVLCASPFRLFDQSGWELGDERAAREAVRSMILIEGGNHRFFSDLSDEEEITKPYLGAVQQRAITRAYVNAFLRWHTLREPFFQVYFKQQWVPESVHYLRPAKADAYGTSPDREPRLKVQFATNRKRVIDHFEDRDPTRNNLGGRVVAGPGVAIARGRLEQLERFSPHDTNGLLVEWQANPGFEPSLSFEIPTAMRDVRAFTFLSFRAGLLYENRLNPEAADQDLIVALAGNGSRAEVRLSDWGVLTYPGRNIVTEEGEEAIDASKSAMATFSIPLRAFGEVALAHIDRISFHFTIPNSNGKRAGALALDNIELIR